MMFTKKVLLFFVLSICVLTAFKKEPKQEIREGFKKFYDEFEVNGSFVLYDAKNEKFIYYNKAQSKEPFSPASTFKICNSLIGLETKVVSDENFVIPWD